MSSSLARRERKAQARITMLAMNKLGELLEEFFAFLDKQPKPSDQEVRDEFIRQENRWKRYCVVHQLTDKATLMFNQEVAVQWRTKYTVPKDQSEI
ncbi:MAG: hypothetical protein PUB73_05845 [Bacteroidales bacterium]|nr:hypothetical protein [Bacteroidales bacterium]